MPVGSQEAVWGVSAPSGYRMIESLEITNFRGYKNLSLSRLPQFNFLIGESGSGKTAFLEALWIVGGISPEIYFRMRALRGVGGGAQLRNERAGYEAFFRDIFFDSKTRASAQIHIIDSAIGARSLSIFYGENEQVSLDVDASRLGTSMFLPIVFDWKLGEKEYKCPLTITNGQIVVPAPPPTAFPVILISSSHVVDSAENAARLSDFSIQKKKGTIVKAVQSIYPLVQDLSTEIVGGQQMIYADLENLPQNIPVPIISSGLNKYLSVLLAIHQYEKGVLLVDELENGFYYKNYEAVVRGIVQFCRINSVQLFASTHSYEMLEAIAAVMTDQEKDFAILHTQRKNGECTVTTVEGRPSKAAIEQGLEVR